MLSNVGARFSQGGKNLDCMFSLCRHGFSPGTQHPPTVQKWIAASKFSLGLSRSSYLFVLALWWNSSLLPAGHSWEPALESADVDNAWMDSQLNCVRPVCFFSLHFAMILRDVFFSSLPVNPFSQRLQQTLTSNKLTFKWFQWLHIC